jgi:Tol biopolymer transport system component
MKGLVLRAGRGGLGALAIAGLLAACFLVFAPGTPARHSSPAPASAVPSVAFVKGDHIWRVSPDGTGLKQLTTGKSEDTSPAWSTDRSTIAFVRRGASYKVSTIYTVPAAGGAATLLYRDSIPKVSYLDVTGLAYSPDGTKLAFADVYSAKGSLPIGTRLVILDIATGRTSVMLKKSGGFGNSIVTVWSLSWSADGSAILIAQQGQDAEGGGTWVYTIISGATKKIPVAEASTADWAADGKSVLLSVATQSKSSIKQTRLDGTVIRTLATGGGWQGPPSVGVARYAPDWAQVVYGRDQYLWVMNADGTSKHKLTTGGSPAWR